MLKADSTSRFRERVLCHLHIPNEPNSKHANHDRFPKATRDPLPNAPILLVERAGPPLAEIGLLGLGLSNTLGQDLGVLGLNLRQPGFL